MSVKSKLALTIAGLGSDRARFAALAVFLVLVFLTGGGARDDIQSLVLLRPAAVLFAAYAVALAAPGAFRGVAAPLWFLLALLALIAAQLIPLPPSIWQELPGRETYADLSIAAGMGDLWRPLSLSPSKTLNSLFSLTVPFAALALLAIQSRRYFRPLLIALALLTLASGLWGLLQLAGSATGPLYLYRITNPGLPVGFFANRNHQAVMLGAVIPVIAHLGIAFAHQNRKPAMPFMVTGLAAALIVPTILMTGSRAGLIAAMIGFGAAAVMIYKARPAAARGAADRFSRLMPIMAGTVILAAIVGGVALWFGRALAIERLLASDSVEELRALVFPILREMAGFFFPAGAGFGAFEHVYYQFEPMNLLREQYLNQAHNDWLQFVIEGGLPAALLLGAFMAWVAWHGFLTFYRNRDEGRLASLRTACLAFIVALGVVSFFDYPLRVPSVMSVFVLSCGLLARTAPDRNTASAPAAG